MIVIPSMYEYVERAVVSFVQVAPSQAVEGMVKVGVGSSILSARRTTALCGK